MAKVVTEVWSRDSFGLQILVGRTVDVVLMGQTIVALDGLDRVVAASKWSDYGDLGQ